MSLIVLILIGLLIWHLSQINYRKIYLSLLLPGPFPLPYIGIGLDFVNKTPAEIWKQCEKFYEKYGDVQALWMESELVVMLSDPKYVEVIFTSSKFIEKSETYRYLKPWLNEGLLLSSGSKWFERRKILTPAFHFNALEEYTKIFNRQSSVFVDVLSKYKTTDKVELLPLVSLCTLDIICEAAMGVELNALRNANSDYVNAVKIINHVIHLRIFGCFIRRDFIFRCNDLYKQQTNALKILHGFSDSVIQERRLKLLNNNQQSGHIADEETQKTKTFLDILLQGHIDGKPLSNLDIREEVDTFMFGGHDTTKSALTFCFYAVARYPEVQRKCVQEIKDILGDDSSKMVSCHELNNLQYLDLVIKETLRLFPSVPLMARLLTEELTIGKYTFPKGATLGFSPAVFGRNPTLFPNPLEFRPERFLEDNSAGKYTFSYFPFSTGPRNCIGQKFAMLELKALVSKVLRHFEISLAADSMKDPVLIGELVTTSEDKINFHLKPRSS